MPFDFTKNNQLSAIAGMTAGLDVPQFYPYLTAEGDVFSIAKFEEAAAFAGHSMGDWEPERESVAQTDGTIGIVSGVVTKTGGAAFTNYSGNVILGRIYVGENIYDVASRQSGTQMTLVNTTVNAPSGSAYKWAKWDYREIDPKYAFNTAEWQGAHDELAYPLSLVKADAIANGAMIGLYDFLNCLWRRTNDIVFDYAAWQTDVATVCSYETNLGFTLLEYIQELGGMLIWDSELIDAYADNETDFERWLTRNGRIMDTLDGMGISHCPIFMRHTVDGLGQFQATGTGTEVPEEYQRAMIEQVHARQKFKYGWWGVDDPTYGAQYAGYTLPATILAEQLAEGAEAFIPAFALGANVVIDSR